MPADAGDRSNAAKWLVCNSKRLPPISWAGTATFFPILGLTPQALRLRLLRRLRSTLRSRLNTRQLRAQNSNTLEEDANSLLFLERSYLCKSFEVRFSFQKPSSNEGFDQSIEELYSPDYALAFVWLA
jgi:hypothetical protein